MAQAELIEHVESGGHFVAEHYFTGQRELAEVKYQVVKKHRARLTIGHARANMERQDAKNSILRWIAFNCGDILEMKFAPLKAKCAVIEDRLLRAGWPVPSRASMYRHLKAIKAKMP
ncbi:MAG: hypothetical protein HGA71_12675 [Azonexaceae bacterium]|nr:hypothetical protein [Azonexaceae bacterium]